MHQGLLHACRPSLLQPKCMLDRRHVRAAGLETFGIKLAEASKLFGKKFASGASITKNAMEKDQIEARMPCPLPLHMECTWHDHLL